MPKMKPLLIPLALMLGVSLALTGCGRKGDLDPPSVALKNGNKYGKAGQTAPAQPDRPFLLDPLL